MRINSKSIPVIISWVLHPIVLPTLFVLLLFSGDYYINNLLRPEAFRIIFLSVAIFTLMIPAAIFTLSRYLSIIESFEMKSKLERLFAITVVGLSSFFCRKILAGFELPPYYTDFITIILFGSVLALSISLFQKFSLHVFGWSIMLFTLAWYVLAFQSFNLILLPIVAVFVGLVGSARLASNAHSKFELYLGFGLGMVPVLVLWIV